MILSPPSLGASGLSISKVHLAQGLEDAVKDNLTLAHRGVLIAGDIHAAAAIESGRIADVAAVLGLVSGVSQQDVGQVVARTLRHMAHVAVSLIVEEAVGSRAYVAQVLEAERLDDIAHLIVQLDEVVRMRLQLNAQALALNDRQQLFHGLVEHSVAYLLLVGVAREPGVDDRHAHINRDLNDALPVGNHVLALLLGRARPAIDYNEEGDFHAGLLQSLLVLSPSLSEEQRVLVERVNPQVWRLLDVLVASVGYLMYILLDRHLLDQHVNVKCGFHLVDSSLLTGIEQRQLTT